MPQITITHKDKSAEIESGATVAEVLAAVGADKGAIGATADGALMDLTQNISADTKLEPVKQNSAEGLALIRHTAAHVMAEAVQGLFQNVKVTIGPVIEDGFYYDFDTPEPFTPEDLEKIEKRMEEIVSEDRPLERKTVSRSQAVKTFSDMGETYKVEIINDLPEDSEITIYDQGKWFDLCRGPHAPSTGAVKAFKLTSSGGAYWRGVETNPMLQRIYGTAFADRKDLKKHLAMLEEAKKRDHRKLGKELGLFTLTDEVGPGLVLWHPKGARVRGIIEDFWRTEHRKAGYDILYTPHLARLDLWKTSGHTDFYTESMFAPSQIDNSDYQIKPMNCPFHILIYKSDVRSYRELPLRWAEIGTVYRYERSGVLHGLLRVRGFSQDDAHIFCRPDQIGDEVGGVLDLTLLFLKKFGFDNFEVFLSTRPDKFVGSEEDWETATEAMKSALAAKGFEYSIDEKGGAFYGPKIDLKIKDVLGRSWQCSTVQLDFNLPKRFDMAFVGEDNSRHVPIMIHRAIFGSLERFFGILVEHYGGAFPLWMSPTQVRVATVTDKQIDYAKSVADALKEKGIRVEEDFRNEKLGYKVREAQVMKIPYLLVIGEKEAASAVVAPRKYGSENLNPMGIGEFIEMLDAESGGETSL
ncbi:MAG: threonine--tRNA ligase [Candidatus Mycalebacterium zealandia]|nr:MAG: threonine--tRNA ligase [Candidatus Mycalebacterium zealandia]